MANIAKELYGRYREQRALAYHDYRLRHHGFLYRGLQTPGQYDNVGWQ